MTGKRRKGVAPFDQFFGKWQATGFNTATKVAQTGQPEKLFAPGRVALRGQYTNGQFAVGSYQRNQRCIYRELPTANCRLFTAYCKLHTDLTRSDLFAQIRARQSYLCVGLDTDPLKLPAAVRAERDPVFTFNQRIIDATHRYAVAYKPNLAFYEAQGPRGWESLQKTLDYIPDDCFTIADAKRGDIGNTSGLYARTFFDPSAAGLDFDAVTVAPYMGHDSVLPFLEFAGKWVILLALTSNPGSEDFQQLKIKKEKSGTDEPLFEQVLKTAQTWASPEQLMFVVGATRAESLTRIRELAPDHFLLVPGVGAQGGSLEAVSRYGMNPQCGLLVNASRSILYASSGADFAAAAGTEARRMQVEMSRFLESYLPV